MEDTEESDGLVLPVLTSNAYTEYRITIQSAMLGPKHPSRVVESSSLAAISLPNVTYKLHKELFKGRLSDVQLEAILLASHSHNFVQNGRRKGMLIGDGAGVGKGRTIAGLILENQLAGRKKSVWISTNNDLLEDAKRDFRNVGNKCVLRSFKAIYNQKSGSLPVGNYCLFATYGVLSGKSSKEKLKAIQKWLRHGFDGIIALDECHAIKNSRTKNALCLSALDRMIPRARFVYCSATAAESPTDIEYMSRLGLWGPGTAYTEGYPQIERVLSKTGFLGMETMAMELKHNGCYVARRLDHGAAEYVVEQVSLKNANTKLYNECTKLWIKLLDGVHCIPELNKRHMYRYYWAAHQRFFRLLSLSFKLDFIVKYTRKMLVEGFCVVLGLQSTGHTQMMTITKPIVQEIPSTLYMNFRDTAYHLLEKGNLKLAQELKKHAKKLELPSNFLDKLVNELGAEKVSELTGRSHRFVVKNGIYHWEKIEDSRVLAQRKFMTGKTKIAILSDASSCGISLHASQSCKNQRRRVHCTLELPWSAEKVIQQCGRTLRSDQASSPKYVLVVTDIAGERRFGFAIAACLQTLGAITQADRTLSVNSMEAFHLGTKESDDAILYALQTIALEIKPVKRYPGHNIFDFFREASKPLLKLGLLVLDENGKPSLPKQPIQAPKFLNRLLGVQLPLQNSLYTYMFDIYQAIVDQNKKLGIFDQGVVDIGKTDSFLVKSEDFSLKETTVNLLTIKADQGVSFDEAIKLRESAEAGIFYTKYGREDHVHLVVRFQSTGKFVRIHPFGISEDEVSSFETLGYRKISQNTAKAIWDRVFNAGDKCFHLESESCDIFRGETHCRIRNRFQLRTILTGILWTNLKYISSVLEQSKINSFQLVRCPLLDRTVLGAHIPMDKKHEVKHALQAYGS